MKYREVEGTLHQFEAKEWYKMLMLNPKERRLGLGPPCEDKYGLGRGLGSLLRSSKELGEVDIMGVRI